MGGQRAAADLGDRAGDPLQQGGARGHVRRCARRTGLEGIVFKLAGSPYRSGRTDIWRKIKNPEAPAVRRVLEEDWGK